MKRIILLATNSLVSLVTAACLFMAMTLVADSAYASPAGDGSVNQTVSATPNAEVRINNIAGSITVQGWSNNQVQVTGTLTNGVTLDFHGSGSNVEVRAVYPHNSHNHAEADLTIKVPAASRLSVNTVSADIRASGLSGNAYLESVSGDVSLDSRDRNIEARSVSGEVTVTGSGANTHVLGHSISGDVKISGVDGDVQAESVSGTVKVFQSRLERARLNSTSGNVDFSAAIGGSGSYSFNTTSGNLSLSFPKKPDAHFDIYSFSGDIDSNFGPKSQRTSEYGPGKELHFTSGSGKAQVTAHTLSGNITLQAP